MKTREANEEGVGVVVTDRLVADYLRAVDLAIAAKTTDELLAVARAAIPDISHEQADDLVAYLQGMAAR